MREQRLLCVISKLPVVILQCASTGAGSAWHGKLQLNITFLDQHPMFERTGASGGRTKQYGDILAMHKGALRVIDVMFSSKVEKTVKALEQEKTNQYRHRTECYKRNISPPFWSHLTADGGSR